MNPFTGPEWAGWTVTPRGAERVFADACGVIATTLVSIYTNGETELCNYDRLLIRFPSPDHARRAIEALVEQGGLRWEE